MRKINKLLITIILIATTLLGIGYSAIQNITLDIEGTAIAKTSEKILITGEEFNKLLKGSTSATTSDTTITRIVFDYWKNGYIDNETVLFEDSDWASGTIVDESGVGGIKLFKSSDGKTVYILSEDVIYANVDSSYMFPFLKTITEIDFNNFNTSKVKNMNHLFDNCIAIQKLNISSFKTENVTTMNCMFGSCFALTQIDFGIFNTSNVQNMSYMFYNCRALTNVDISNFTTEKVQNMDYMFAYCIKLKELDLSSFNTTNVKSFAYMFYQCYDLAKLDISKFDTSNATKMNAMFGYLYSLKDIDVLHFNTSNVTTMERMFNNSKFEILDLSNFDTSKVTSMKKMFTNSTNLTTIYVSDKWTTEKVNHSSITDEEQPFLDCTNLIGGAGTTYDSNHTDISYARVDGGANSETPGYLTLKSSI